MFRQASFAIKFVVLIGSQLCKCQGFWLQELRIDRVFRVVLGPAERAELLFSPRSSSFDLRFAMTNLGFVYEDVHGSGPIKLLEYGASNHMEGPVYALQTAFTAVR